MAASLPAKLKIKEITPFATRAAQLEKFKPIVAYWCNYYIVDQILAKGLHAADEECMTFTTTLMDKLEQVKNEQVDNDAITDDIAAKAYIEQFALETFQRGDDAIHNDKASRQTIDTFHAAATFLDLLNMSIWAPVDPEMAAKSKYAKYHAVRIAKAIKAGEDPNASSPKSETPLPPLDPQSVDGGIYRPPTVESAPESKQPSRPGSVVQPSPFAPPPAVPSMPAPPPHPISPTEATDASRNGSIGGGYFPSVPGFTSDTAPLIPPPESALPPPFGSSQQPSAPTPGLQSPADFYNLPSQPPASILPPAPAALSIPSAAPIPPVQAVPVGGYRTDDDSVTMAQKHAKWAQSALNFEDVPTAVKELRLALQSLGAL